MLDHTPNTHTQVAFDFSKGQLLCVSDLIYSIFLRRTTSAQTLR
jgi:hypothetical protein